MQTFIVCIDKILIREKDPQCSALYLLLSRETEFPLFMGIQVCRLLALT